MRNRSTFLVVLGASSLVCGVAVAPSATAAPAPSCQGSGLYSSTADVDGDSHSDVVVGVPTAHVPGHYGAGVVDIHLAPENGGGTQRIAESKFGATPGSYDNFGAAVSFLNANDDQCADLAIGAPGADSGSGTVTIALGSDNGVSSTGAITLKGTSAHEGFGSSVVADSTGDDLWISAPGRTVDGAKGAGAVDHYRVDGGVATLVQTLTENTPGVPGLAEAGDGFGRELNVSADGPLVVGEPAEDVGSHAVDAGSVTVVYDDATSGLLATAYTYTQNSPGIPGTAESGDHFGTSVASEPAHFVVGVPGEALGHLTAAGTVDSFYVYRGSPDAVNATALSQNSPGVPGGDEADDRFGKQVVFAQGLCIGVPGEGIGTIEGTGDVLCVGRHDDDGTRWDVLHEGTGSLGGSPQRGAGFGTELSTLPFTELAGSPDNDGYRGGEDLLSSVPRANISHVVSAGQVRIESRVAVHDSAGPVANGYYGIPAFVVDQGAQHNFDAD